MYDAQLDGSVGRSTGEFISCEHSLEEMMMPVSRSCSQFLLGLVVGCNFLIWAPYVEVIHVDGQRNAVQIQIQLSLYPTPTKIFFEDVDDANANSGQINPFFSKHRQIYIYTTVCDTARLRRMSSLSV